MGMRTYISTGYCVLLTEDYYKMVIADIRNKEVNNDFINELRDELGTDSDIETSDVRSYLLEETNDSFTTTNYSDDVFEVWKVNTETGKINFSESSYNCPYGTYIDITQDSYQPLEPDFCSIESLRSRATMCMTYIPTGYEPTENVFYYQQSITG